MKLTVAKNQMEFTNSNRFLILPGWRQSDAHWRPVRRWLERDNVSTVTVDIDSLVNKCVKRRGSVSRIFELRNLILESIKDSRFRVIIGHSAGSELAVLLAAAVPKIDRVVLVEPIAARFCHSQTNRGFNRNQSLGLIGDSPSNDEYPLARASNIRTIRAALNEDRGSRESIRSVIGSINPERVDLMRSSLANLRQDVLMLRGQHSGLMSASEMAAMATIPQTSRICVIPEAGHSPHIDQPRRTSEAILLFGDRSNTTQYKQESRDLDDWNAHRHGQ